MLAIWSQELLIPKLKLLLKILNHAFYHHSQVNRPICHLCKMPRFCCALVFKDIKCWFALILRIYSGHWVTNFHDTFLFRCIIENLKLFEGRIKFYPGGAPPQGIELMTRKCKVPCYRCQQNNSDQVPKLLLWLLCFWLPYSFSPPCRWISSVSVTPCQEHAFFHFPLLAETILSHWEAYTLQNSSEGRDGTVDLDVFN